MQKFRQGHRHIVVRSQSHTWFLRSGFCQLCVACLLFASFSGCASLTFPTGGVPARRLPPSLLREPQEDKKTIDLSLLRQEPPETYRLAPGDLLGVWIEGVLGTRDQAPPVQLLEGFDLPPALGFPVPVREDGTVALPLVDQVRVEGMSLVEAQNAIRKAYIEDRQLLQPDKAILVSLMKPRVYHILVIRQDSPEKLPVIRPHTVSGLLGSSATDIARLRRGTGTTVELPAYKNDVLNALAETGGLPGLDAANEIIIQRGGDRTRGLGPQFGVPAGTPGPHEVRIPLRMRPGEPVPFQPADIVLETGDIVFIESRDPEVFYTGGLLPSGEYPLPRDYDLDVLEAIAAVKGPIASGGVLTANFSISNQLIPNNIGGPSPSLVVVLRRTSDGRQVPIRVDLNRAIRDARERILIQPGDVVLLQQTPGEAVERYLSGIFRFDAVWRIWTRRDSTGQTSLTQGF